MNNKYTIYFSFLIFLLVFSQFFYSLRGILTSTPIDFYHYYLSSKALLTGQNPYIFVPLHKLDNGMTIVFNYPPTALLFFWPLALFPVEVARLFWEIIIFSALVLTINISLKILKIKTNLTYYLLLVASCLLSFPIRHTFGMGQVSITIGLLLILSFYFSQKEKNLISGFFLSLAISLKTFPLIFLLYYLLTKQFKIVASALLFLFGEVFISWLLVGSFGWSKYLAISPTPDIFLTRANYYEQSISAFFARLPFEYSIKLYLFFFIEIFVFLLAGYQTVKNYQKNEALIFSLFLILATIALGFNWQHYFALLVFPFIIIGQKIYNNLDSGIVLRLRSGFPRMTSISCFILFFLSYILISTNIKNPEIMVKYWGLPGILILSHELYGALILFSLSLWLITRKKLLSSS